MKELRFSNRFKKDFKRYRHDREKLVLLNEILHYLENGITIPMKFKPHMLMGITMDVWNAILVLTFCLYGKTNQKI